MRTPAFVLDSPVSAVITGISGPTHVSGARSVMPTTTIPWPTDLIYRREVGKVMRRSSLSRSTNAWKVTAQTWAISANDSR